MPTRKGPTKRSLADPLFNRRPEPRDLTSYTRRIARLAAIFKKPVELLLLARADFVIRIPPKRSHDVFDFDAPDAVWASQSEAH